MFKCKRLIIRHLWFEVNGKHSTNRVLCINEVPNYMMLGLEVITATVPALHCQMIFENSSTDGYLYRKLFFNENVMQFS